MPETRSMLPGNGSGTGARLARGAVGGVVASVVGGGLAYGLHVLLARMLGATHYGILAWVLSWVLVLQLPGLLGLPETVVRFAAAYEAQQRWGAIKGLLRWSGAVALASGLGVGALLGLAGVLVPEAVLAQVSPEPDSLRATLLLGAATLPIIVLSLLWSRTLRAFGAGALSLALERAVRPGLLVALCLGFWLLGQELTAPAAMLLHGVAFSLLGLGAWVLLRSWRPRQLRGAALETEVRPWLDMALPSVFIAGMSVVLDSTDRLMIGGLMGVEAAGIYNASTRTAMLVGFGLTAVNAMLGPMISSMHTQGDQAGLQRLLGLAAWGLLAWTGLGAALLLLGGPWILALFGPAFVQGYGALAIMVVAQMVNATCGSVGLLLMMTGHQRQVARVLAVAAGLNLVLNLALIPAWGMEGAALASGLSMAAWNLTMLVLVRKELRLNPTVFRLPRWARDEARG